MRRSVIAIAVIAAACSSAAFAGEVKQDKKAQASTVKAQIMSDAQMDKVTAGDAGGTPNCGNGNCFGYGGGAGLPGNGIGQGRGNGALNGQGRF